MAVAAADFYTYARATGTPLPKSKQEEANLAPAVDKWKKSRLVNNNQQENNVGLGEAAGLTAALAGIGASVVAARNPNVRRDLANLVRPGKATSTNVGGIKQDLNVKTDPPITDWENYKKSINLKYPETNEPYIDPGRQSDLSESYRLQEGRKQADTNLSVVSPEEVEEIVLKESAGEIPPGMQTPEQQAVVNEQDFINQAILKVQDDANAQAAAADYTRAELNALRGIDQERKNILNPRGYIESTGAIEPSLTDIAKIDDLSVSQQSLENTNLNLNANANAGLQIGLDPEITNTAKSALTQADINAINNVGITGTRIAGPSNVQSIRNNQTLTRQGPVVETEVPEQTFLKTQVEQRLDKLQQETTELKAIGQNLERAGQLISGGTRAVNTPGTTTFDNAMASDMVARAGIKPRITSQYYQKNISLPKTMRQAVDTESRDPGRMIDTEAKGGGGRKVTAYNPDSQDLSTVGPYGIERANYPQSITSIAPSASPRSWTPTAGTAGNENVNIVISGGRDYTNYPEFAQKTDQVIREMNIPANKKITIVEGGAKGADKLGERYARERGYGLVVKPADWSKGGTLKYPEYDKSAGPRRNEEMAQMGDVGIAFPGGKGTSNFVKTMARKEGKPVYYANQIKKATPEGKIAIEASEEIRKIYSSGRPDAQQQVQAYIQGLRKGQQF